MKTHVTNRAGTGPLSVAAGTRAGGRNQEDRLLSQLRAGEEEAFETLVLHYQEALIRMARRYVADRATAEDLVQETWIAVMNGLNRFEGRSSLYAWICAILIHKAKDRGIREKRRKIFSGHELEADDWKGEADFAQCRRRGKGTWFARCFQQYCDDQTPEKLLASRQATACMWQAIETLPALQREVLMLRDVHGIHTKDVCEQLKISGTNLYVRLHRARERVKVAVEAALG